MDLTKARLTQLGDWIAEIGRHRSRKAFASTFQFCAPKIIAILMARSIPRAPAEEIAQEVMAQLWRDAPGFDAKRHDAKRHDASMWIWMMVRDHAYRAMYGHSAGVEIGTMLALRTEAPPTPDDLLIECERLARTRVALASLPQQDEDLLWDAYDRGMPHAKIALARGLPLGTVKTRLRQAVLRLRAAMRGRGG